MAACGSRPWPLQVGTVSGRACRAPVDPDPQPGLFMVPGHHNTAPAPCPRATHSPLLYSLTTSSAGSGPFSAWRGMVPGVLCHGPRARRGQQSGRDGGARRVPSLVQEGAPARVEEGLDLFERTALGLGHAAAREHQAQQAHGGKEEEGRLKAKGVLQVGRTGSAQALGSPHLQLAPHPALPGSQQASHPPWPQSCPLRFSLRGI